MTISNEAVEAAARRIYLDSAKGRRTCEAWESLDDGEQSRFRLDAERILEAAAPHLMADATVALDEARAELEQRRLDFEKAADRLPNPTDPYGMNQRRWLRTEANPYRSVGAGED